MAAYELDPWGPGRDDLRSAAAISYQLAPYLDCDHQLPSLHYPYFEDREQASPEEITAALQEHHSQWAEWEAENIRRRELDDGQDIDQ